MRRHTYKYADTYAGECGHVCRRMRTSMQQYADTYKLKNKASMQQNVGGIRPHTYAGECGHVCRRMQTRMQQYADIYEAPMQQNVGGIRPREASD